MIIAIQVDRNCDCKSFFVGRHISSPVSSDSISVVKWAKNNKNGWKFIPKTLVATEENVQLYKGETNV